MQEFLDATGLGSYGWVAVLVAAVKLVVGTGVVYYAVVTSLYGYLLVMVPRWQADGQDEPLKDKLGPLILKKLAPNKYNLLKESKQ